MTSSSDLPASHIRWNAEQKRIHELVRERGDLAAKLWGCMTTDEQDTLRAYVALHYPRFGLPSILDDRPFLWVVLGVQFLPQIEIKSRARRHVARIVELDKIIFGKQNQ